MNQEKPVEVSHGFPGNLSETPKETTEQLKDNYSSQELAKMAGVSVQAWRKSWLHYLQQVAPIHQLKRGRQYTRLAAELTLHLKDARDRGWTGESWLELEAWPKWGNRNEETPEVLVDKAFQSGAVVPVEVLEAGDAQHGALVEARKIRGFAQLLAQEMMTTLIDVATESAQGQQELNAEAIAADELLNIAQEEQIRAKVRAEFQQQKQAADAARLAQRMEQFKGGSSDDV